MPDPEVPPARHDRGEAWVAVQVILLVAIILVPARIGNFVLLPDAVAYPIAIAGIFIGLLGLFIVLFAARLLGPNLTIFPRPRDSTTLIRSGLYGIVRHPIYLGVLLCALGWSLFRTSVPALILTAVLFAFFDRKARMEEGWLEERFADYADYRRQVRKLIPWVY